jgi:hypothetical protein
VRLAEIIGSGPFRDVPGERVAGARNVYAKFDGHVPRQGTAGFIAGPRRVHFDQVEWLPPPDPTTPGARLAQRRAGLDRAAADGSARQAATAGVEGVPYLPLGSHDQRMG